MLTCIACIWFESKMFSQILLYLKGDWVMGSYPHQLMNSVGDCTIKRWAQVGGGWLGIDPEDMLLFLSLPFSLGYLAAMEAWFFLLLTPSTMWFWKSQPTLDWVHWELWSNYVSSFKLWVPDIRSQWREGD